MALFCRYLNRFVVARRYRRALAAFVSAWLGVGAANVQATILDDAGLTELRAILGDSAPSGSGVPISMVEAPQGTSQEINDGLGRYFPDTALAEFATVTFHDGTGKQSNGVSTHATSQARTIASADVGIAPGLTDVTVYDANYWLTNILKYRTSAAPATQNFRVQNHSWIGS
ncbi:MAG: hypothetical protein KDA61_21495, partial [Planctomycetales bacterium]|nr:hypothetical protein [Planctomycetales bacterium]